MADLGGLIFARRASFLAALAREAQRIHYEALTAGREVLRLNYLPRLYSRQQAKNNGADPADTYADWAEWLESASPEAATERFREALQAVRGQDMARGRTTIGPQRDDWAFVVNGRDLGSYGSRGQQRTAVLALKMAEINWMAAETGETPVLLLDEVVAELDEGRRTFLLNYIREGAQAILTATDPAMFTGAFLDEAHLLQVQDGRVEQAKNALLSEAE